MLKSIVNNPRANYLLNTKPKYFCSIRLQYISDLHLEFIDYYPKIKPNGNYLALLGDIGNPFKSNYFGFIQYCSQQFEKVFVLFGNHECYAHPNHPRTIKETIEHTNNLVSKLPNVHFMNNKEFTVNENYKILGTTLWSHIDKEPIQKIGDDIYIQINKNKQINYTDFNRLHFENVRWLENRISNSSKKIIILSHHLPSYKLIDLQYQTERYSKYQNRFASNLDYLLKPPVKAWLCGHSHTVLNKYINDVYCGINAAGYPVRWNYKKINMPAFIDLD